MKQQRNKLAIITALVILATVKVVAVAQEESVET